MPFEKKKEIAQVRSVRVTETVETIIKKHCGTLAQGLREYAEQLTKLDNKLKKLNNGQTDPNRK